MTTSAAREVRHAVAARASQDTSASAAFLRDVLAGLRATPKRIPPKWLYDRAGSALFDAICDLPEYYLTRTELALLRSNARAVAERLSATGPCVVVEPGAGSGTKTRVLLRALGRERCVAYVPIDIAWEHLSAAAIELRRELPWLTVIPHEADFFTMPTLPAVAADKHTVVYFPGSTLGNFEPDDGVRLLATFRHVAGKAGQVLVGLDLKKPPVEIHAAYNDASGVTAEFNKNLLRRINVELAGDFDPEAFHHYALYSPVSGRIEMHLVSAGRQTVHVAGERFAFEDGESICTEHSYKFDLAGFEALARRAGLRPVDTWTDEARRFAMVLLGVT